MRLKKEIDKLTEQAKNVSFPASNYLFHNFYSTLRKLVAENFGYSAGRELQYDEDAQDFSWEEKETVGVLLDSSGNDEHAANAVLTIRRRFVISANQSLAEQFERIAKEREDYAAQRRLAYKGIHSVGGKSL